MPEEMKVCRKCHLEKPATEFSVAVKATGARMARCKSCASARVRTYYADNPVYRAKTKANSMGWAKKNPEQAAKHRHRSGLKYKYDLTPEQYAALLRAQDNACALCGATEHGHKHNNGRTARLPGGFSTNWPIDHCHKTNAVRGLLCHACNVRLGGYEVLLGKVGEAKLVEYLTRPSPVLALPTISVVPIPDVPAPRFVAELPPRYTTFVCAVEGCGKEGHAGGLCHTHYVRARRRGGNVGTAGALPHAGSKLTDDDIRAIRGSTDKGYEIAAKFGISGPTVSMIRNRKIWTHVA